jgi:hypothetical protein
MRELSLHILDILQNSVAAGATLIQLTITEDLDKDLLDIETQDNGMGMDEQLLARVLDPFVTTRSVRKVGLGIPLFAAAAEHCDGCFEIKSTKGKGTWTRARFRYSHVDRAPLGDMSSTIAGFIGCNPDIDLEYVHVRGDHKFSLDTRILREKLENVPLNHVSVVKWIREFIAAW